MSVRKLTASLLTALVMLSGLSTASAQFRVPVDDPFSMDGDFRWFEPIYDMDIADLTAKKRAATGLFGTYDRMMMYGSRPELNDPQKIDTSLDSGYGHRYEFGFMNEDDRGFLFSSVAIGVHDSFSVETERLNRFVLPDDQTNQLPPFGLPPASEDNTPGFNRRIYFVEDVNNSFAFNSYELSRTWRSEPYHYGGILEPMVGVRWFRLDDLAKRQDYISSADVDQSVGGNPPLSEFGDAVERLTTNETFTDNEALAAQLGFRYFKFQDRFMFSTSFRAFAGGNWQSSFSQTTEEITIYDGIGQGSQVDSILFRRTQGPTVRNEEFFLGFDVRADLSYQLTKMIRARSGFQVINLARGLWRGGVAGGGGNPLGGGDNDQDLQMAGITFGLELNR